MSLERTGVVAAINSKPGMIAIETNDDGFTIIELLSDFEIAVGDKMLWPNGHGLGSEVYKNVTKGTFERVFVQNHAVSSSNLKQQLLL